MHPKERIVLLKQCSGIGMYSKRWQNVAGALKLQTHNQLNALCQTVVGLEIGAIRKIKVQALDGINEILRCRMKSSQNSDEIFSLWLQMKSNPLIINLAKQDFIAKRFHPRSGFIPTQADFINNSQVFV